ncbi:MAG: S8 family serine peptidase, partial [Campylobacterales bacterium]
RNNTSLKFIYRNAIKGFTINLPCHTAEAAFGDSDLILSMEPDRVVSINKKPTDAGGGKGKNKTSSQTVSYGTVRVGGPQDGTGYTAWVIDTGVDLNHKDLTVDAGRSFSVFSRDGADDKHGHGTHVAGIIGAKDNSIGSLGVAPNTSIVPIRVLDRRGYGSVSGVIAGVDYVATNARAGDCVNMSLSGGISASLDTAVLNASNMTKAFFTLAAGNELDDANNYSPARVNGEFVHTVSAIDAYDNWAYFSNFGNPPVDYAAPGVNIFSLWKDGGTHTASGTSMAAPHACAVLMLTNGSASSDSTVNGDPDNHDDPIIHLP